MSSNVGTTMVTLQEHGQGWLRMRVIVVVECMVGCDIGVERRDDVGLVTD